MNAKNKYLIYFFVLLIGLVFLSSSYLKISDSASFTRIVASYGLGIFSNIAPLVIIIELVVALHLIFFVRVRTAALVSFFLILFFTIIYTYGLLIHNVESCGCFGSLWKDFFDKPIIFYSKNVFLLIISYLIYNKYRVEKEDSEYKLKIVIILVLTAFSIFVVAYTFEPYRTDEASDSNKWIGTTVDQLNLDELCEFSEDSVYMVFMFSYSCPHCLNSVANVNLFKQNNYVDNIIFLPVGNDLDKHMFDKNYKLSGIRFEEEENLIRPFCKVFPTTFFIKNKSVIFVKEGFVSAPLVFIKTNKVDFLNPIRDI